MCMLIILLPYKANIFFKYYNPEVPSLGQLAGVQACVRASRARVLGMS